MSTLGKAVIGGLEQVLEHERGVTERPRTRAINVQDIDVRSIRRRTGMSQTEFAAVYGLNVTTLQAWEQRKRRPDRMARLFLRVVDKEPEAVRRAVVST